MTQVQQIVLPTSISNINNSHNSASAWSGRPTSVFGFAAFVDGCLVSIPPSRVRTTAASIDYMSRKLEKPPTVCGNTVDCVCHDKLHIKDEAFLQTLRSNAGKQVCCAYCDDVFSRLIMEETPQLQCISPISIDGHLIPMERLSLTAAVPQLAAAGRAIVANICKDHMMGCCGRGKDCSSLHVCRKRGVLLFSSTRVAKNAQMTTSSPESNLAINRPTSSSDSSHSAPSADRVDSIPKLNAADYY